MKSTAHTVTTTASLIIPADNINRTVYVHVVGNNIVYLGGSDVTASNGLATEKHTTPFEMFMPPNETIYAIVLSGTEEIRVLTPNVD